MHLACFGYALIAVIDRLSIHGEIFLRLDSKYKPAKLDTSKLIVLNTKVDA
jgi:hypothetical protein